MIEIIIFAALSGYIFYRLWSVLGTKTGNEQPRNWQKIADDEDLVIIKDNDVETQYTKEQNNEIVIEESEIDKLARELEKYFNDFSLETFQNNTCKVFKIILNAYANNNTSDFENLVNEKVLKNFKKNILQRTKDKETMTIQILNVEVEIEDIEIKEDKALIKTVFSTDQVVQILNSDNEVIYNPSKMTHRANDEWIFEKYFNTKDDKKWILISTKSLDH